MSDTTRVLRPDAQAFDEVRIRTVPRYKTSRLSGDEWRISAVVEFWRKGVLVHECGGYRNVETAIGFLYADYHRAIDDGKAYFAGEGDRCDQEGCADIATVTYRVKEEFSRNRPHEWHGPARGLGDKIPVRRFCARHSRRGDCGFDDSDANYELIGGNPTQPLAADVRESARVVMELENMEDLPAAVRAVKDKLEVK